MVRETSLSASDLVAPVFVDATTEERVPIDSMPGHERVPVGDSFAAVAEGERLVTVGSHGNVEGDVNRGRGDEAFGLSMGDSVRLERVE